MRARREGCSMPSIEYLRAQQLECARYIIDGGPDQRGARLGLFDAFAEEFLMEEEGREMGKRRVNS